MNSIITQQTSILEEWHDCVFQGITVFHDFTLASLIVHSEEIFDTVQSLYNTPRYNNYHSHIMQS